MSASGGERRARWWSLLPRGESAIASAGLFAAGILLLTMGAGAWWAVRCQREADDSARRRTVESLGALLSEGCARLLAEGDLSGTRLLVVEAARNHGLSRCRVVLPDGGVLADATPAAISVARLPETWPEGEGSPVAAGASVFPIVVPGRGAAGLVLAAGEAAPAPVVWRLQTGIGMIGAAGMAGVLLLYRRMRRRLRGLSAIREALGMLGSAAGEGLLRVSEEHGPEATVWNALLAERESLRNEVATRRMRESLSSKRDPGGDLARACDALWLGLMIVDQQGVIRYANGAAAVLLGVKRESLVGAPAEGALADAEVAGAIAGAAAGALRRRSVHERTREGAAGGPGPAGAGVLRFSVRPVRGEDAPEVLVLVEDVTQQRLADAARNSFVAQATHELRTPLTNIRLYVEQALEEGEKDPSLRAQCLNVINTESRRLERTVSDMLSVAEIEAGALRLRVADVRAETLFKELEEDFAAQAEEKGVGLRFDLPPKWPVMQGDRDKLALALHNLVGNAIKYTPEGGQVLVGVDADEQRITVRVKDTGIGISEDEAELVFEKFYRSRDQRIAGITGSGLGLALAREVARLHGGDIAVQSRLNEGSTFVLTVPARAAA